MSCAAGQVISWAELKVEEPVLAEAGESLLFRRRPQVGWAFIATLRKDGAPRLHPVRLTWPAPQTGDSSRPPVAKSPCGD